MRRRLDLAACLVVPRPVIFLDEPTTGLDPASRIEMWDAIAALVEEGAAVLLTTQYLDEADRLADEIVVLSGGRTVAAGTPSELKARVGDRRVQVSLPDADGLAGRGAACSSASGPSSTSAPAGCPCPPPTGARDLQGALDALEDAGLAVEEAALSRPTLDDAFFVFTGGPDRHNVLEEATP